MHPPCSPNPQEQLWQRQREGSTDPGCADDDNAHPPDARTQPRADPGGRLEILCPLRTAPAFADKKHGKRLKGYKQGYFLDNSLFFFIGILILGKGIAGFFKGK